jgi:hypothetical protein
MKNIRFLFLVVLTAILLMNACDFPAASNISKSNENKIVSSETTDTPAPVCQTESDYGIITILNPGENAIVSTTPELAWQYTPEEVPEGGVHDWSEECVPTSYTIFLSTGPDFGDEIVLEVTDPVVTTGTDKLSMVWTIPNSLEFTKVYRWAVVGHANGFDLGNWTINNLHDESKWPPFAELHAEDEYSAFRTGPECAVGQIESPILTWPANDEKISTLSPTLTWVSGSCMPTLFYVEISTNHWFANPELDVNPEKHGDFTKKLQVNSLFAVIGNTLRNCADFKWRVKGGVLDSEGNEKWGAFSEIGTIQVDLDGKCPTPTPKPTFTPTPTVVPTTISCYYYSLKECGAQRLCQVNTDSLNPNQWYCENK